MSDQFHADELPTKASIDKLDKLRFRDFLRDIYNQSLPDSPADQLQQFFNHQAIDARAQARGENTADRSKAWRGVGGGFMTIAALRKLNESIVGLDDFATGHLRDLDEVHQPVELMTFIKMIENALGKKAIKNMLPMQAGDVVATFAETSELREAFGFAPSTSLQEGVEEFVEWFVDGEARCPATGKRYVLTGDAASCMEE